MTRTRAASERASTAVPSCATGPAARLGFVLTELRDLAAELRATWAARRATKEQH